MFIIFLIYQDAFAQMPQLGQLIHFSEQHQTMNTIDFSWEFLHSDFKVDLAALQKQITQTLNKSELQQFLIHKKSMDFLLLVTNLYFSSKNLNFPYLTKNIFGKLYTQSVGLYYTSKQQPSNPYANCLINNEFWENRFLKASNISLSEVLIAHEQIFDDVAHAFLLRRYKELKEIEIVAKMFKLYHLSNNLPTLHKEDYHFMNFCFQELAECRNQLNQWGALVWYLFRQIRYITKRKKDYVRMVVTSNIQERQETRKMLQLLYLNTEKHINFLIIKERQQELIETALQKFDLQITPLVNCTYHLDITHQSYPFQRFKTEILQYFQKIIKSIKHLSKICITQSRLLRRSLEEQRSTLQNLLNYFNSDKNCSVSNPCNKPSALHRGESCFQPELSILINGCKLKITHSKIVHNHCKIVVLPFLPDLQTRDAGKYWLCPQIYPNNIIPKTPFLCQYLMQKACPQQFYFVKAMFNYKFDDLFDVLLVKISNNQMAESFAERVAPALSFIENMKNEDQLQSVAFSFCSKMGNPMILLRSIYDYLQKGSKLKQIVIHFDEFFSFLNGMSTFQTLITNLFEKYKVLN